MKHPYQNLWSRVSFCVQRNGLAEVFLIPIRMAVSPFLIPLLPRREVRFRDRLLPYFYHNYNLTWANERAIEVPIALSCIEGVPPARVLEIGNVLSHYGTVEHEILDKFEVGPGVINEDILSWNPSHQYDLIISVSTFEHIGFDDEEKDATGQRILSAIERCRTFLSPAGRLVITAASGYNRAFDDLVAGNRFQSSQCHLYHRVTRGRWEPCDETRYLRTRYNSPYAFGNAVAVASFTPIS